MYLISEKSFDNSICGICVFIYDYMRIYMRNLACYSPYVDSCMHARGCMRTCAWMREIDRKKGKNFRVKSTLQGNARNLHRTSRDCCC